MSSRKLLSVCMLSTAVALGMAAPQTIRAAETERTPMTEFSGKYVRVSPELELYYEEAGTGRPLIFITGWTGTNEFFTPYQISHFSHQYRAIAMILGVTVVRPRRLKATITCSTARIYVRLWMR
jgi:hypothetical protein